MSGLSIKIPGKIRAIRCNSRIFYMDGNSEEVETEKKKSESEILKQKIQVLENELQSTREEAFQAGIDEGFSRAQNRYHTKTEDIKQNFFDTIQNLGNEYQEQLKSLTPPLINLSRQIAEKILMRQMSNPDAYTERIINYISQLIEELSDQEKSVLHVSKEVYEVIGEDPKFQEINNSVDNTISLIPDMSLLPGECVVETENHRYESLFKKYLDKIETGLAGL